FIPNMKRLEDVPIMRDILEVFREDLPGLSLTRRVEFQIDLVPDVALVARPPYRLAPSGYQKELNMRQRRWLELLSDYNCEICYHPGKANVVVDAEENVRDENLNGMNKKFETRADGTHCIEKRSTQLDMSTAYHPQNDGQSERSIQTLEDMLRACVMDFGKGSDRHLPLVEFSYNNSYHASIKAAPLRHCTVGKLKHRYIRPFKILAKVGTVAYRLELPEQLSRVHSTFHVSNLNKCLSNETLAIPLDEIQIDDKLYFVEEPVEIMNREVKRLKQSRILIVKVRWNSRRGPEFTREHEDQFEKKYLHLFAKPIPSASTMK
ncbi:putative reverse transcriptase domain-containing protein, partial [Tanacetum coccineum]